MEYKLVEKNEDLHEKRKQEKEREKPDSFNAI